MVRVTDFARPKRTYDKDDIPRRPLAPQDAAYQSQRAFQNPRSEARRLKRKAIRESDKECFVCREKGHLSQDCPKNINPMKSGTPSRICYRCGRIDHSLKDCKKPPQKSKRKRREYDTSDSEGDETEDQEFLPFAKCYLCQQSGHLAGSCPQNDRGIYPNGGGCKLCGATDHLKRKCPQKEDIERGAVVARKEGDITGADEDAYHERLREENRRIRKMASVTATPVKKKPKIVKF